MGNVHNKFDFSWVKEATWNTRPSALYTGTGTTTYRFGDIVESISMPSPLATINEIPVYSSWEPSSLSQDKLQVAGEFPFLVRNGIEFYYMFGVCSTTGASAPYTHAITARTSGEMPSRVFHVEQTGGGTDFFYDVQGVKTSMLKLHCSTGQDDGALRANLSYMATKIVDSVADTNPAVEQTGVVPALPVQTNKFPFRLGPTANYITWNNADVAELLAFDSVHTCGLLPRWTNPTSLDEYGKNERRWAQYLHEDGKIRHGITLTVIQENQSVWNDMMDQLKRTFVIKFSRDATNDDDYIQLTASNSIVQAHEVMQPIAGIQAQYVIGIMPTSVAVEVKDDLGIAYYEVA